MAATIPSLEVLIIDMSAPFGWTSSPAFYGAFGGAITWLVSRESPNSLDPSSGDNEPFIAYEWVDDHVLVEPHIGNRLHLANEALRLSLLAVLGPGSINEEKFSAWETKLQVLGLEFDTAACTISMPHDKSARTGQNDATPAVYHTNPIAAASRQSTARLPVLKSGKTILPTPSK